jgi:hypothetical protein
MEKVSKSCVLHNLEEDWSPCVNRYNSLSEEEKEKFLANQGYKSLSDLMAHVIAWWEEAIINLKAIVENPQYQSQEYEVDAFNAEVVRKNAGEDEKEIIKSFEENRKNLLNLISTLGDKQIQMEEMQKELYWNITNHYQDHKL